MLTLLPVINEIQTGVRLQMALAVYIRLVSLKAAGVLTPTSPPVSTYVSKIGAYGSISKLDLHIKFEAKQLQALPPNFVSALSQAVREYSKQQEKIREEQSKERQRAKEKIHRQKQFQQQQRQYQQRQQQQHSWIAQCSITHNNMPPEFDPQFIPACKDGIPDFIRQYLAKPPSPERPASPVAGPSQCKRQRPSTYTDMPNSSTAVLQTPRDILDDGSPFSDANYQPDEALLDEEYEYGGTPY
jgi:type II secretory pathway pseudopilin PulG